MAKWCPLLEERVTYMACQDCGPETKRRCAQGGFRDEKKEQKNTSLDDAVKIQENKRASKQEMF